MNAKIKVHALAQNRTALGIMHAYLELNPGCTLADLKAAFPDSLNPDSGVKVNFKTLAEVLKQMEEMDWKGYFTDEDCLLKLKDGSQVAVVSMWTAKSLERLVEKAKGYGIEVAPEEEANKAFCKKRGFYLTCTAELKQNANCSEETRRRYDEHSLNFLQRIDEEYFENIKSHLTEDTGEFDMNLIHYNFEKEGDTVTVYADGEVTFVHKDKDVVNSMALGVLKGYVENLYKYYAGYYNCWKGAEAVGQIAPDCSVAQLKKFVADYAKNMNDVWDCADVCDRMWKIIGMFDAEPKLEDDVWDGYLKDALENYMYCMEGYAEDNGLCNPSVPCDMSGYLVETQMYAVYRLSTKEQKYYAWWQEEEEDEDEDY